MSLVDTIDPLYSISGFSVGVLVGMTGVGGGSLMTPLLILMFGIHPATAVGTDLLFAATTKVGGSFVHGIRGSIDWTIVRRLTAGSVPAAAATLVVLSFVGLQSNAGRELITFVLGVALFLTALALIFRKGLVALLRRACRRIESAPHCAAHRAGRIGARRAGVDFVGRRRRPRRHGAGAALSAAARLPSSSAPTSPTRCR